jgi:hypothetical protein
LGEVGEEMAQTMYTDVSKCENDEIKGEKTDKLLVKNKKGFY